MSDGHISVEEDATIFKYCQKLKSRIKEGQHFYCIQE